MKSSAIKCLLDLVKHIGLEPKDFKNMKLCEVEEASGFISKTFKFNRGDGTPVIYSVTNDNGRIAHGFNVGFPTCEDYKAVYNTRYSPSRINVIGKNGKFVNIPERTIRCVIAEGNPLGSLTPHRITYSDTRTVIPRICSM